MDDIKKQYKPIGKKSSFKLLMYDFIRGLYKERDGKTIWAISTFDLMTAMVIAIALMAMIVMTMIISPQISDTLKQLEAIIDRLNNLQVNDCKAAKAIVATAANAVAGGDKESFTNRFAQNAVEAGGEDLYSDAVKSFKSNPSSTISTTKNNITSGNVNIED